MKETVKENVLPVQVPGNRPYREYGKIPLIPHATKSCSSCGLCAKECPVNAIPTDNPKVTDNNKCISCMHCVNICPRHARKLNPLLLSVASKKLKKVCFNRKENELFL